MPRSVHHTLAIIVATLGVLLTAVAPAARAAPAEPMGTGADCTPPSKLGAVFVVDDSGSNSDTDFEGLRGDAALAGVAAMPDRSVVSVSTFSDEATTALGTTELNAGNRQSVLGQVGSIGLSSFGGTNYEAAFTDALGKLDQMSAADKKVVIFLTDGEPTEEFSSDAAIAARGVPIYSLGYGDYDKSILAGISARSGGKLYSLQGPDDARAAFADIVDTLTCRSVFDPTNPTVKPGKTYERPFSIAPLTTYFRATVAWNPASEPSQIQFVRPDGTKFPISGPPRANESLVEGTSSVQLVVDSPKVGRWKVRVKGDPNDPVKLTVDASTAYESEPGKACPPGVSPSAIQIGEAKAYGCFTDEGNGVYSTTVPARIGGFDADPDNDNLAAGAQPRALVLDTARRKIETRGKVSLGLGGLLLPGSPTDLPIGQKAFELSLDNVIRCQKGKDCVLAPPSKLDGADAQLWGLKIGGAVKASWTGEGNGGAKLELSPSVDDLLEPLLGKVLADKSAVLEGEGGGLSAKVSVAATNDGGFELGASELTIKPFKVVDKSSSTGTATTRFEWPVTLSAVGDRKAYGDDEGYLWTFDVSVEFPGTSGIKFAKRTTAEGSPNIGVGGTAYVFDGRFAGAGAEASGLNIPLGTSPVFLQRAQLQVLLEPGFGVNAETGITAGPQVAGAELVSGDPIAIRVGTLAECQTEASPDNIPFQVAGTATIPAVAAIPDSTAEISADLCYILGDNAIEGSAGVKLLFFGDTGLEGNVTGWIDDSLFNLSGDASIKLPGLPDPGGSVIISSVGVAGCGGVLFFEGGVGYRWGGDVDVFEGCDLSPWEQARPERVVPGAAVSRAADPNSYAVRKGVEFIGFRVRTAGGGAPQVRITGPGGRVYDTPAPGAPGVQNKDLVTTRVDQLGQAFMFIHKPEQGEYTVSQLGGPPIDGIEFTRPLPPPRVRGDVKAAGGRKRTLRYRVRPMPGQRVIFYERGDGTSRKLGFAEKRRGAIRYRPVRGGGKRRIVAEVRQGGLPRKNERIANYRLRGSRPPGAVREIRLSGSRKKGRVLRWSKARRAKRYYVSVRYRGRELERGVDKNQLRLGAVASKGLRVKVQPARGQRVGRTTKRNFR